MASIFASIQTEGIAEISYLVGVWLSVSATAFAGHYQRFPAAAANRPALHAAVLASMAVTALMLLASLITGIVLYRRSIAPALPHHSLLEELETASAGESERNHTYEM
jgi:hypothetical protein